MEYGIVIVGCGARKLDHRAPAGELYTGPYFADCIATARELWPPGRIFILSALYGLVTQYKELEPYDLVMGMPGSVTADQIRTQAYLLGVTSYPVTALCGSSYIERIRQVWRNVETPLSGLGLGQQRRKLRAMRTPGHLEYLERMR